MPRVDIIIHTLDSINRLVSENPNNWNSIWQDSAPRAEMSSAPGVLWSVAARSLLQLWLSIFPKILVDTQLVYYLTLICTLKWELLKYTSFLLLYLIPDTNVDICNGPH